MKTFVTGASGFIGGAIAEKLAERGHDVSALSRSEASDTVIRALKATPARRAWSGPGIGPSRL